MGSPNKTVIMSKKVAKRYLDRIAIERRTLTVFFNSTEDLVDFVSNIKEVCCPEKISIRLGFDEVTFITADKEVIKLLNKEVTKGGFDSTEI